MQAILVRDKLRYFNNGIEVDASGRPIPMQNPTSLTADSVIANLKASNDDKATSQFVELVLSQVPEMSHIMAGFLTSVKRTSAGSPRQNLSVIIDMALAELNSIDQEDLNSIDPKCSDLASRVMKCISGEETLFYHEYLV